MKFFEAFANIFRVPDLRKRVLFTLGLLAVFYAQLSAADAVLFMLAT